IIKHSQTERSELSIEISTVYPGDEILAPHHVSKIFRAAGIIDQMQRCSFSGKGCEIDRRAFASGILHNDMSMLNGCYRRGFLVSRYHLPVRGSDRGQDKRCENDRACPDLSTKSLVANCRAFQ